MTNAEKYKEVFGMEVDPGSCPARECEKCPCGKMSKSGDVDCVGGATYEWWKKEYKETTNDNC